MLGIVPGLKHWALNSNNKALFVNRSDKSNAD